MKVHGLPLKSRGKTGHLGKCITHVLSKEKLNANQQEKLRIGGLCVMNTIPLQSIDSGFKPTE